MKSLLASTLAALCLSAQAVVTPLEGVTPQKATALSPFPTQVAVRVTDESGRPVAGVSGYFAQAGVMQLLPGASGDCWIDFMTILVCRAATDFDGIARFPAMRAAHAASFTARVSATNDQYPGTIHYGDATLEFTADPIQPPARLVIAEGDNQRVAIGSALAPIVVRLETPQGLPIERAPLWYAPYSLGPGGFQIPPSGGAPEVQTDSRGMATLPVFQAGWGLGEHEGDIRYFDPRAAAYVAVTLKYTTTNEQGGDTLELGDLWWGGASESGWGLSATQRGERLFNVWFVYDASGRPTWFVQPGGEWHGGVGAYFQGPVYSPRSAPWFAYDTARFSAGEAIGNASMSFMGPSAAWSSFDTNRTKEQRSWGKRVERQPFGGSDSAPLPGVGGLWWGGMSQNGWGVAIHEHGSRLFLVWFTYDAEGAPTWFVMPDGAWTDRTTHSGVVYRTSGPPWTQASFDPAGVHVSSVGTYRLMFESKDSARMEMRVEGRSVSLRLERQLF